MNENQSEHELRVTRASAARQLRRCDEELQRRGLCPCGGTYGDLPTPPFGLSYTSTFVLGGPSAPSEAYFVPMPPPGKRCPQCGAWTAVPSVVCNPLGA